MQTTLAYLRASTNKQEIDLQIDLLQRAGYDELYQEHISGTRRDRPEFQRLVARALELSLQGNEVHVLVVNDSRWARDVITSLSEIERLERAGCKIRSIEGGRMSLATPEDFLMTTIKAATAQHYSLNLGREIKRRYNARRAKGVFVGNRPPWAYRIGPDGKLIPDPEQWPIARQFVERLLAGESYRLAIIWLNEQGVKRSQPWLKLWIKSAAIRGHTEYTEGGITVAERKAGVKRPIRVIYGTHEPLITEAEYSHLMQRVELRRQLWGANADRQIYPVPPVVTCGYCGKASSPRNIRRYRYWRCNDVHCQGWKPSTPETAIEAAIQEAIVERAEDLADAVLAAGDDQALDPRVLQLESEIRQLAPLAHRPAVALEIQQMESELAQLKAAPMHMAEDAAERRALIESLSALTSEEWAVLSSEERRQLYSDLVEGVTVEGRSVVEVRLRG